MNLVLLLIFVSTILDGLFAGIGLQKLFVELPARKKIGAIAFAEYSRASDLGNGLYLYPFFAILGILLKFVTFILAIKSNYELNLILPLGLALAFGIGILVMTAFAAPQMLKLRKTENKDESLSSLLEKFVVYSYPRTVFMELQFLTILWALAAIK